jgi:hypothetical protein
MLKPSLYAILPSGTLYSTASQAGVDLIAMGSLMGRSTDLSGFACGLGTQTRWLGHLHQCATKLLRIFRF